MAIAMTKEVNTPKVENYDLDKARWEVWVANELDRHYGMSEWVADCDTLDEAVELAQSYKERYFVTILSKP